MRFGLTPESTLSDKLALLLSGALSPFVVVPIFTAFLVGSVTETWSAFFGWYFLCVALSTGVPFLYIGWHVRQGLITDIHVSMLEQRDGPFMAGVFGLGSLTLALLLLGAPSALTHLVGVVFMNSIIFAKISRHWKISVHTGSLGVCLAGGIQLMGWSSWWNLLQLPLIWARAARKRHHPVQGVTGAVLGYTLTAYPLRWLTL